MLPKLPLGRILIKHFATKSFQKPNTNPKHSSFKNSINQSNLNINNTNALDNQSLVLSEKILGGDVWSTGSLHSKYLDLKPGALVTCGDKIHIRLQSKPVDELKNEKMFNAMLTQLKGNVSIPNNVVTLLDNTKFMIYTSSHVCADAIIGSIIYKDERILIINKPINLSVHGGSKHNNLHLEMFLDHLKTKEDEELRIVHRLDKDTTGCLILARTKEAAAQVSSLFNHSTDITKRYIAVCVPPFEDLQTGQSAIITTGISKVTRGNTERMEAVPWDDTFEKSEISDIKKAVTKVTVLKNRKLV
ncbi:hypothetical protein HDV02_005071 [Globomyces sp. JEL0801]|nr:hypothetical protein HDV02_005071 [Globomyces sp. JEL0801]